MAGKGYMMDKFSYGYDRWFDYGSSVKSPKKAKNPGETVTYAMAIDIIALFVAFPVSIERFTAGFIRGMLNTIRSLCG